MDKKWRVLVCWFALFVSSTLASMPLSAKMAKEVFVPSGLLKSNKPLGWEDRWSITLGQYAYLHIDSMRSGYFEVTIHNNWNSQPVFVYVGGAFYASVPANGNVAVTLWPPATPTDVDIYPQSSNANGTIDITHYDT